MPEELTPSGLIRVEAAALEQLAQRLDGPHGEVFSHIAALLCTTARSGKRVILTGIGKSGLIARKIAATMISTGTPAHFMHPAEAIHGDLGLLTNGDVLLALSYSGESEELLRLLPVLPRLGVRLVAITGCLTSTMARASEYALDVSVDREACTHRLAPTTSTTAMLALGDALAIDVSRRLDFQPEHFAELHPGGQLGKRLQSVGQLMRKGDAIPSVPPTSTLPQIIHEISAKRLGITTVQHQGKLLGILSDGDLRRLFERDGPAAFHATAAAIMNASPRTVPTAQLAGEALEIMERHKITALIVIADGLAENEVLGVVHLHDILS